MNKTHFPIYLVILLVTLVVSAGCNFPQTGTASTPTLDVTQAYQTVEARLTQAIALTPSAPPSPTATDRGVTPETPTSTPKTATPTATTRPDKPTPTKACDLAAPGNPIDVTIPDGTEMQPGQTFTKIWRLQNTGTCTWTPDYSIAFFSGEPLDAPPSVPIPENIAPGQSVEVSVDMIAPRKAGTYQSNWKLRNASNAWFGIGSDGNSPFWAQIVVRSSQTITTTPTVTTSVTPTTTTTTPSPTGAAIKVSGTANLLPGAILDLDNNQVNSSSGADLSYEINAEGLHGLIPSSNTLIDVFGVSQPTLADCQTTSLNGVPIILENLAPDAYLCYRTDQGLYGWAYVSIRNPEDNSITLQILTWSSP